MPVSATPQEIVTNALLIATFPMYTMMTLILAFRPRRKR